MRKTEDLFVRILSDLCRRKILTQSFLQNILLPAFQSPFFQNLKEKAKTAFSEKELLPVYNGDGYCRACEARLAVPYNLPELVNREQLCAAIGSSAAFVALKDIDNSGKYYAWLKDDLQIEQWNLCNFAELISDQNLDDFGGSEEVLLFLTKAWKEGGYSSAYRRDLSSCYSLAQKKLAQKAIIPNQAGGFSPAWSWHKKGEYFYFDKYLYFKKKKDEDYLPKERYVSLDAIKEDKRADFRNFIGNYFEIRDYELEDYIKTVIIPKYETEPPDVTDEKHVEDMRCLFLKCGQGCDVYVRIKASDGAMCYKKLRRRKAWYKPDSDIWFEVDTDGNSIKDYFEDLTGTKDFVDLEFYESHSITRKQLQELGIQGSLLVDENKRWGKCSDTKDRSQRCGEQHGNIEWRCYGSFRFELSVQYLREVLGYIGNHRQSELAKEKSKIIWNLLMQNKEAIHGYIKFGNDGSPVEKDCHAVFTLMKKGCCWVFDKNGHLVRTSDISQYDLDPDLYKPIPLRYDSNLYRCLRFKEDERDSQKRTKERITKYSDRELAELFEGILSEMKQRGISYGEAVSTGENWGESHADTQYDEGVSEFPWAPVWNFDRLKRHVEEGFACTSRVRYEKVMRSIRVTQNDSRSYLSAQYKSDSKYGCQLCHRLKAHFESVEFEETPKWELDQMHLSLCPDCAAEFRDIRSRNKSSIEALKNRIRNWDEQTASDGPALIPLGEDGTALWFSPVHLAEVKVLLELLDEEAKERVLSDK